VELGKLDLPCFWYALLSAATGKRTTLTAHDAPTLALHPAAGLLPQRSRLTQILTYRLLAPLLDRPLERVLLRRARAVAVLSELAVDSWHGSPSPRRLLAIAHGADARGPQGPPSDGECVLLAGYLGPSKGVDTLLAAWREMGHESSLPLWILGDTTGETHRDWLEGLRRDSAGFSNPPVWLGSASDEQWRECFRKAAVVVLPYRYSSPASGPLVRAMVEGRAIVMSEVPATRGLIVDGENGLTVPREDPQALAETLRRVLNDVELMVRLGRAAERTAAERFSWSANARGIEDTLLAGFD
jgi:glycosyltransferase involved in cell wall biosynthesis